MYMNQVVFIHRFANSSSRKSRCSLVAAALVELLGQGLWLQLFLTGGMRPLTVFLVSSLAAYHLYSSVLELWQMVSEVP